MKRSCSFAVALSLLSMHLQRWLCGESLNLSLRLNIRFKYRLAYVVGGECVMRYDNERVKVITGTSENRT